MFLNVIQVVDAVNKTFILEICAALCSPELTKVVGDIFQCDAHQQHPKQWRERDVDPEDLREDHTEVLDGLTSKEGEYDEDEESKDSSSRGCYGSEDGPS